MIKFKLFILFVFSTIILSAQNIIEKHLFTINKIDTSKQFTSFIKNKIENSQFIMLGEQHGIKEVSQLTNLLYNIAYPYGYNTLCIETSPFAANVLDSFSSKNIEEKLKGLYKKYPVVIPFYNNKNDIEIFENLKSNQGKLWGIDQVFMVEFRLIFDHLVNQTKNTQLRNAVKPLLKEAIEGFDNAVKNKNYMAPFMFKYTDKLHSKLMTLAITKGEKELLKDLKKTKEIYLHNFQKRYYQNNNERAMLMKHNFLKLWNTNLVNKQHPKVLFKLGANHVGKGLNGTNVFDIANLISELAIVNNKKSLHMYVSGINGMQNLGNPFAPVSIIPFDYSNKLPEEIIELLKKHEDKYIIIDAEKLREQANTFSNTMKELILKYDILIYIKNCNALEKL